MNADIALQLMKETLVQAFILGGPILALTLVVGVLISIIQTVTSIQEMTITFVPKVVVIALALVVAGPWMLHQLTFFTVALFQRLPDFAK
jgi:flagellar biosynthetic protein FliQ